MAKPSKKEQQMKDRIDELTQDIQRLRADFENYRKRVELDKPNIAKSAKAATVVKLLPVIDTIERAIAHIPKDLADNAWVKGIAHMHGNLDKQLAEIGLQRIKAVPKTPFDPEIHEAVMMQDAEGDHEVIAEELRPGYISEGSVVRPAMVKVTKITLPTESKDQATK